MSINPDKPRKGCFEVRTDEGAKVVSLLVIHCHRCLMLACHVMLGVRHCCMHAAVTQLPTAACAFRGDVRTHWNKTNKKT